MFGNGPHRKTRRITSAQIELAIASTSLALTDTRLDFLLVLDCPCLRMVGRIGFEDCNFPSLQTLKAESSVACAFEGLDNIDLAAFRQNLRQSYSEASQ